MPAPHWSLLPLAAALAAAVLGRRRVAPTGEGTDGPIRLQARRARTVEEAVFTEPTPERVYAYAAAGCPDREIADRFMLTVDGVRRQYGAELVAARGERAFAMRRAQTDLATGRPADGGKPTGHNQMLQWIGVNELGQSRTPTAPGEAEPELD